MSTEKHNPEDPAQHFATLPEHTKEFLRELRPEEIRELREGIEMLRNISTVSRFLRWTIITIVAVFVTIVSLGESIAKVFRWFTASS